MEGSDKGHRVFAWFYAHLSPGAERRGAAEHRRKLLSRAEGVVVEIGAGTGLNFPHYPAGVTEVLATEPDPHMLKRLRAAAAESRVPVRVVEAGAESLPLPDGSADTVVATLVLCSVTDVQASLGQARRVLKPGGRLLFYEHVRAQAAGFARWQDRFERPWGFFGAGCHPNRDSVAAIGAAGFEIEEIERFDEPGTLLAKPHVLGSAVRTR
ncbi:MAG: class I SAM-dependent methyltransferase [Actinomycetota bacterium]